MLYNDGILGGLNMTQTELAIKKVKKQISEIKILERKEKQKLEDNELKLSKMIIYLQLLKSRTL